MATGDKFVQPSIPRFDGYYDHWSMLMENFLRSKELWQMIEDGIPAMPVGISTSCEAQRVDRWRQTEGPEGKELYVSVH